MTCHHRHVRQRQGVCKLHFASRKYTPEYQFAERSRDAAHSSKHTLLIAKRPEHKVKVKIYEAGPNKQRGEELRIYHV